MNGWKIQRINTATGAVTLEKGGEQLDVIIPLEHRAHPNSHAYLRKHVAQIQVVMEPTITEQKTSPLLRIILAASALAALALLHQKGIL